MEPDAIVILAGTIKPEGDRWVSTGLSEKEASRGAPGQKERVEAAVLLALKHPHAVLVPSGGIGHELKEAHPPLAEVIRDELTALDIAPEHIEVETSSNNTFQQLQALASMSAERGWTRLAIVTNRWHVPRTEAMLKKKFPALGAASAVVGAEDVILEHTPERAIEIDAAYRSDYLLERVAKEKEGVRQIEEGMYRFE